jgi:hypothetical protein
MIRNRHLTTFAVAVATVMLMAGPSMAVGFYQPPHATYGRVATTSSSVPTLCSENCSAATGATYWPDTPPASSADRPTSASPTVSGPTQGTSFAWGDAAIGAGAAVVLMLLIGGGVALSRHSRPRLAKAV